MELTKLNLNEVWKTKYENLINLEKLILDTKEEKPENHTRFVIISDTHEAEGWIDNVPIGDILIHCGDFTMLGGRKETLDFVKKFESLPHKFKIVVAGNHELTFDTEKFKNKRQNIEERFPYLKRVKDQEVKNIVTQNPNLIYLEDSSTTILNYKIYGNPIQPYFYDWGFNVRRHFLNEVWSKIPVDADVVVTHGPPLGIGDLNEESERCGDEDLLNKILEVKPKLHCFGHIHNDYGLWKADNTVFANAAICDIMYQATRKGIVVDLPNK